MYRPGRSTWWLIVMVCAVSALAWFTNTYTPNSWQQMVLFFILIAVIVSSLLFSFINKVRHVFLITGGIIVALLLRLFGLREIIYPLLLVAIILSIELMLRKR